MNTQAKSAHGAVRRLRESVNCQTPTSTIHLAGDYSELRRRLEKGGLFVRQPGYYVLKIVFAVGLLILSVVLLAVIHDFRLQILDACFMAIVCTQLAFFFHDAGHRQIFQTSRMNDVLGLFLANLLLGWSYSRWVISHNQHHAHPNQEDLDPDISDVPFVAFTEEQAREKHGPLSTLTKFQACCFPFLTLFSAFSWRIHSIQFLWQEKVRYRTAEVVLLAAHSSLYFGLVFFFLPVGKAVVFVLCHNALFGLYIGSVFAASHKGMVYLGRESRQEFLRQQILSTRNIHPNPFSDLWYGPMACHIEHHLFPCMPRTKLAKARRIVKAFCLERGIPYHEVGGLRSYWETLRYLHSVSAPLRKNNAASWSEIGPGKESDGEQ